MTRALIRLWSWPVSLGLLTMAGLVIALVGDGCWDSLSTLALAVPVVVGGWHALRR